jgi:hypothetical protein
LSVSEFYNSRPLREAQGSPKGRVTWAISFGSFSFSEKKMNKMLQQTRLLRLSLKQEKTVHYFSELGEPIQESSMGSQF